MHAAPTRPPITFAGLPVSSWAFAIRIWLALLVALYVSFWLNLEAPSTAALTIAVLAFPTRGQAVEKACFRLMATTIGVAASIAMTGMFAQSNVLILAAFAAWMGLCVYVTSLLDGNRAYAAALCGTTVALIAMPQLDSPQMVFQAGMARGAAIAVGVLAVTFVNDFLAAPDFHPKVAAKIEALQLRFLSDASSVMRGEARSSIAAAGLLHDMTALRPEIASLAPESSSGQARYAAACAAAVDTIAALFLARALRALPVPVSSASDEQIIARLGEAPVAIGSFDRPLSGSEAIDSHDPVAMSRRWLATNLLQKNADTTQSLGALRAGIYPLHQWRVPLYRSHRLAMANGVRAGLCFALIATFLALTGWPTTASCLSLVGVLVGLSATVPDVRAFTTLAAIVAPISCLLVGILEFVVLDGVTDFPLLAIGLAPFIIGSALLISIPNLVLSSLGRANLVFTIAVFAPSNPQSYNPQTFLFTSLFLCLAALSLFVAQFIIPPLSNGDRLRRLMNAARRDLGGVEVHRHPRLAAEEAIYRDAVRVGKIVAAAAGSPSGAQAVEEAMWLFDQAATMRLCGEQLDRLDSGILAGLAEKARTSLTLRDARAISANAEAIRLAAAGPDDARIAASASLILAAHILSAPPPAVVLSCGDAP